MSREYFIVDHDESVLQALRYDGYRSYDKALERAARYGAKKACIVEYITSDDPDQLVIIRVAKREKYDRPQDDVRKDDSDVQMPLLPQQE